MIVLPDPWDALALGRLLPERHVLTYEAFGARDAFEEANLSFTLVPPGQEQNTRILLEQHAPSPADLAVVPPLVCFKPSARLEGTGHRFALSPARVSGAIENKLNLPALAEAAGVLIARQAKVRVGEVSFEELAERFGLPFVAQSPRGFAGRRTFRVASASDWADVETALPGRPLKVAAWAPGQPGTSNAVVDSQGQVLVSAPILQLTGEPDLTPQVLGSCGNDFTWRPAPDPTEGSSVLTEALGPVLAERGYCGHFGVDWVWDGERCTLIEVNARLTASFALYCSYRPELLHAHLAAHRGEVIRSGRLGPIEAGQEVVYNLTESPMPPLSGPDAMPAPGRSIAPGEKLGRRWLQGPVVGDEGHRLSLS